MQKQKKRKTIQGEIEKALNRLNITSSIKYAGRTDTGVHALNQVISFEIGDFWDLDKLKNILNKMLLPNIYFKKIEKTTPNFNPQTDAIKRSYRYLITNKISPFTNRYLTYYNKKIDIDLISEALKHFEGIHDFEYFAKTGSSVNSYIREIFQTDIFKFKDIYVIKIYGKGFLRSQIRIIVNFLLEINEQRLTIDDLKKQINKQKLITKKPAPPNGLYLERIWYKDENGIIKRSI